MAEERRTSGNSVSIDTEFGRMVVEQNLATKEELDRCVAGQVNLEAAQAQKSLAQIMVEAGVITKSQMARLNKTIEDSRGRQIPGYRLIGRLGRGAMATVFKAKQLSLDRMVAIKVLPRKLSDNAEYVEMFYREGKAAAKLNHPNIVQAFDVGEAGGFHYFVMEYVEGHTLYDDLSSGKVFSEAEALDIIIQMARALEHAHNQGLIHRDVKPKNIMITTGGVAKLADMGLARLAADVEAAIAETGRAFGTPYYISPEQIRGERDVDFRADIYSLGATLYHLLTGRVPFEADTPMGVMQRHLNDPLIPPDHINAGLSAGIGEVVEVMMAKNRNRRYASTTDLMLDLEAISAGEAPLQARKQIDASVLTGLAEPEDRVPEPAGQVEVEAVQTHSGLLVYLIIVAIALAVSVILNIILVVT